MWSPELECWNKNWDASEAREGMSENGSHLCNLVSIAHLYGSEIPSPCLSEKPRLGMSKLQPTACMCPRIAINMTQQVCRQWQCHNAMSKGRMSLACSYFTKISALPNITMEKGGEKQKMSASSSWRKNAEACHTGSLCPVPGTQPPVTQWPGTHLNTSLSSLRILKSASVYIFTIQTHCLPLPRTDLILSSSRHLIRLRSKLLGIPSTF